jgi:hypothetical protein
MLPTTNAGVATHSTTTPITPSVLKAIWIWLSFWFLYGWHLLRDTVRRVRVTTVPSVTEAFYQAWERSADASSPYYYVAKVAFLTKFARLSGRSYLLRFRDSQPQFIAAPGSIDVRPFLPNTQERLAVIMKTGIDPSPNLPRCWRIPERVRNHFRRSAPLYQNPPAITIDLTGSILKGGKFIQGRGLMGHDFHVILIEEYGRWPGNSRLLAGRGYSWVHEQEVLIKMPIGFAAVPTVLEEYRRPGGRIGVRRKSRREDFV